MNPLSTLSNAYNSAVSNSNSLYNSDVSNEGQYQNQYNTNYGQAQAANQSLQNYTGYMQGAGSATNLYNQGQQTAFQQQGFDPSTLATATQNLTQSQNALANMYSAQSAGAGGMGRTQSQLANYYSTLSNPLQQQVSAQGNAVNNLQQLYQNALTNANQYAGVGVQGETATLGGLNQGYQNDLSEQEQAQSMLQFYANLAQNQQNFTSGLAPSYSTAYGQVQSSQASAANAYAQAQQEQLQNQGLQNYYNSDAYKNQLLYGTSSAPTNIGSGTISIQGGAPGGISLQGGGSPQNAGTFNLGNVLGSNFLQGGGVGIQ